MPTDTEELRALVLVTAKACEPGGSTTHDGRDHRDCLDVGDSSRAAIETGVGWEGRLQSGSTGLALKALNKR